MLLGVKPVQTLLDVVCKLELEMFSSCSRKEDNIPQGYPWTKYIYPQMEFIYPQMEFIYPQMKYIYPQMKYIYPQMEYIYP
jgi:hypothetical protein